MKQIVIAFFFLAVLAGCEDTDLRLAAEAGLDAVTAITLSDEAVSKLSADAAGYSDHQNPVAGKTSPYAKRLDRITADCMEKDGVHFNYKVYIDPTINAFAMGDGTIRVYSGLMDMMADDELRFVIGHEMGHIVKRHVRKKMQLAYAASALRKGIASQNNAVGDIARSQLGGFAEKLVNAQFSQQEEREADDYGLMVIKDKGFGPGGAVSALRKLATLSADHSFLSSHPAPDKRADRLEGRSHEAEGTFRKKLEDAAATAKRRLSEYYEKLTHSF